MKDASHIAAIAKVLYHDIASKSTHKRPFEEAERCVQLSWMKIAEIWYHRLFISGFKVVKINGEGGE